MLGLADAKHIVVVFFCWQFKCVHGYFYEGKPRVLQQNNATAISTKGITCQNTIPQNTGTYVCVLNNNPAFN